MEGIKFYQLSKIAEQDLMEIFDFTEKEFGIDQAVKYVSEFDQIFGQLLANPQLGNERNIIKGGLRSIPKSSHVVFYRIMEDHIRIVRILHGSRDLPNFLRDDQL